MFNESPLSRAAKLRFSTPDAQGRSVNGPPGHLFRSPNGKSGASIAGSGEAALIPDVNSLGELAAGNRSVPARSLDAANAGHKTFIRS